jgi:hypothetical protein
LSRVVLLKKAVKRGIAMKETKNSLSKILLLLASACLVFTSGCGYTIVKKRGDIILKDSELSISHPTIHGKECWDTGYIQKIEDDIRECLEPDK